ncbi:MAG: DUF6350 family protein [Actinomycetia bacterium]|nr:DUF6350 family protein [Actinomycetes bacterium]
MTTSSRRANPATRASRADAYRHDSVSVAFTAALSAGLVALIGLALSFIVTLGSWALAPHASETGPDAVARVAVGLWLYTHHVPLNIDGVPLGLVPIGLLLIPGLLAYAGGRQVARVARPQSLADVTRAVIPYALVYGVLAAVVAGVVRSEVVQPAPRTAFFAATLIAVIGGGWGLLRGSGLQGAAIEAVPPSIRAVGASAAAGLATVVMVAAVLTTVAIAIGFPDAAEAYRALDAGWSGAPVLLLLTLAFVPNLVMWTAALTTGVGFGLGGDGVVSPQSVDYGALPVFPPLAALPPQGEPGVWAYVALAAPLLGGYAVAAVLYRRQRGIPVEHLAARAAAAGALAGAGLGVCCWLSAGSVGDQALTALGPVGWRVGVVAAVQMALVAAVVAWELHRRQGTARRRLIDLRDRVALPPKLPHQVKTALRRR